MVLTNLKVREKQSIFIIQGPLIVAILCCPPENKVKDLSVGRHVFFLCES